MEQPTPAEHAADAERYKQDYLNACKTIADMYAAATGRTGMGPVRGVIEDVEDVRLGAERAAADLNRLRDALNSVHRTMVHDSRDWALDRRDAWLYAILIGWTCEEGHAHDDDCMGDGPLTETAARHRWDADTVARLRAYRAAIAALGIDGAGLPVDRTELPVIVRIANQEQ